MKSEVSLFASIGYPEDVTNPRKILLQLCEIRRLRQVFSGTVPQRLLNGRKRQPGGRLPFPKRRKEDEMKKKLLSLAENKIAPGYYKSK
ncbi:MAG: hypothetical protein LUD80_02770 [Clostridiales bacterium]|nr:hypothetical protein [Clostridiales bacterium]